MVMLRLFDSICWLLKATVPFRFWTGFLVDAVLAVTPSKRMVPPALRVAGSFTRPATFTSAARRPPSSVPCSRG